MTISLAIDTSTSRTVVGLLDGEKALFEKFTEGATDHGRAVSDLVAQALLNNPNPEQVVVGMGPGPFTGLRVGIAFARTFALSREIPVIGVCSLTLLIQVRAITQLQSMRGVKRFTGPAIKVASEWKAHRLINRMRFQISSLISFQTFHLW